MRIAIATPVWGRFTTTELWWKGVSRLAKQWAPHEVKAFVCGDELEHEVLAKKYGGEYIEHPNDLGKKFNAATEAAWRWGADYAVILGSDDLISPLLAERYLEVMGLGVNYFGLRGCYMVEPSTQRALYLSGHANPARLGETVGAGRTVSRWLLDRVQGRPWPERLTKGADFRMTLRLQGLGIKGTDVVLEKEEGAFLLDVKGGGNLWKFNHVKRSTHVTAAAEYEGLVGMFPTEEQEMIRKLELAACPTCGTLRPW